MLKTNSHTHLCDLCGYHLHPLLPKENPGGWLRCSRKVCALLQRSHFHPEKPLPITFEDKLEPNSLWDRIKETFTNRLDDKERWKTLYLPETPGLLLDIGTGDIHPVLNAAARGWNTHIIHTNSLLIEKYNQSNQIQISHTPPIWEKYASSPFDAIIIRWYLEQVPYPSQLLRSAWNSLIPGGRLIIFAWNASSYGHELYGKNWLPLHIPQFKYIFTASSLRQCLYAAGIKCRYNLFCSSAGQLPQSNPPAINQDVHELHKKIAHILKEEPMSGEALILTCNKHK